MANCLLFSLFLFHLAYLFLWACMYESTHVEVRKQFWGSSSLLTVWVWVLKWGFYAWQQSTLLAQSSFGLPFLWQIPRSSSRGQHTSVLFMFQQGQCGIIPLRTGFHLCHLLAGWPWVAQELLPGDSNSSSFTQLFETQGVNPWWILGPCSDP